MLISLSNFSYFATALAAQIDAAPQFWQRRPISEGRNPANRVAPEGDLAMPLSLQKYFHFYFTRSCSTLPERMLGPSSGNVARTASFTPPLPGRRH
ncbi:hypothetical protein [Burkholderia stabilis]|uniref:hypothetical protein n=1 Tax=Burkholderia stabilis TaxID=95485 RepID=UPI001591EE48|nr:hypothetical protein [Burkholderia stabilis]